VAQAAGIPPKAAGLKWAQVAAFQADTSLAVAIHMARVVACIPVVAILEEALWDPAKAMECRTPAATTSMPATRVVRWVARWADRWGARWAAWVEWVVVAAAWATRCLEAAWGATTWAVRWGQRAATWGRWAVTEVARWVHLVTSLVIMVPKMDMAVLAVPALSGLVAQDRPTAIIKVVPMATAAKAARAMVVKKVAKAMPAKVAKVAEVAVAKDKENMVATGTTMAALES